MIQLITTPAPIIKELPECGKRYIRNAWEPKLGECFWNCEVVSLSSPLLLRFEIQEKDSCTYRSKSTNHHVVLKIFQITCYPLECWVSYHIMEGDIWWWWLLFDSGLFTTHISIISPQHIFLWTMMPVTKDQDLWKLIYQTITLSM